MQGWRFYNHAAIPEGSPLSGVDLSPVEDGTIWKAEGERPLLARWTTDFDCDCESQWWYVIKDTPFDPAALKAKRRYEINKGQKNFEVRILDPRDCKEALYRVQVAAFSAYPSKYRPTVNKESFFAQTETWGKGTLVLGAFSRETGALSGYALLVEKDRNFVSFNVLKTDPVFEKYGVNAALVEKALDCYSDFLKNGGILCDGERNINHETAFQDYLQKYFGFRKAYCRLHIAYNPKIRWIVRLLYPFRRLLCKLDSIRPVHKVNAVLKMETICRAKNATEEKR